MPLCITRNTKICYLFMLPSLHDGFLLFVADLDDVLAEHFLCGPSVQLLIGLGNQVARRNPPLSVWVVQHPTQPPVCAPAVQYFHHVAFFQRQTVLLAGHVLGNGDIYRIYLHTNVSSSHSCDIQL